MVNMKLRIKKFFEGVSVEEMVSIFENPLKIEGILESIQKVELLSDVKEGVGVKWKETRVMFGKEATEVMWITKSDRQEGIIVIEAASMGVEYESTYKFEEKDGGVELEFEFLGKPVTLMAKLMTPVAWLFKGVTKKALEADLDEMKKYFEK